MAVEEQRVLERMLAALNEGDVEAAVAEMDPEIEFVILSPTEGRLHFAGIEAIAAFWNRLNDTWDDYRLKGELVAIGPSAFVISVRRSGRGRASGIEIDEHRWGVWTFRDGRPIRW